MRHPLMIMMTMASALSQWVIRTVSGCTITLCKRPAVTSVIAASRRLRIGDRRKSPARERGVGTGPVAGATRAIGPGEVGHAGGVAQGGGAGGGLGYWEAGAPAGQGAGEQN